MKNAIVPFKVIHKRLWPKKYNFTHNFFWFKIDLDDLQSWPTSLVSINRFNLYSFYDKDHVKLGKKSARENFIEFAKSKGLNAEIKNVTLYTQLRFIGYVFNPISLVMLTDVNDKIHGIIEIGNTFNELKPYFVNNSYFQDKSFTFKTKKYFYISPFINHDNELNFNFLNVDGRIRISIENFRDDNKILQVFFDGKEIKATTLELIKKTILIPFVTFQIIFLIHFHALILWIKGIEYFKKEDKKELQQGTFKWKS